MSNQLQKIKTVFILVIALTIAIPGPLRSQDFPEPMNPPRMVNDFSGFLDPAAVGSLEKKLQTFYNSSSTQIYIIILDDLKGYDPSDYATRIGEKWKVGTGGKDNGIVILVKPKTTDNQGEVFISVGYGLEGVVPDITAHRIVDSEIIPRFKVNDFGGGLTQAVDILISLTEGEFSSDQYMENTNRSKGGSIGGIIFMIILFIIIFGGGSKSGRNSSVGRNLPFWLLLSMMGSGSRSHGGSFGGFSGGSGSFGGGFGGGGGGSFGGGGAGGSW